MWVLNGWKKSFSLSNSLNHPLDFTLSFSPPTHNPPAPTGMVWVCFLLQVVSFLESSPSESQEWEDAQKRTTHQCMALYQPGRHVCRGWGCWGQSALCFRSICNRSNLLLWRLSLVLMSQGSGADFGLCLFFSQRKQRGGSRWKWKWSRSVVSSSLRPHAP